MNITVKHGNLSDKTGTDTVKRWRGMARYQREIGHTELADEMEADAAALAAEIEKTGNNEPFYKKQLRGEK